MNIEDTIRIPSCFFHDSITLNKYIHGGNATVVLAAPSGKCHKYQFIRPKEPKDFPESWIFVYSVSPTHKNYMGLLDGDEFRLTKRSQFNEKTEIIRGMRYLMRLATETELINNTPMEVYHEGFCGRCGRVISQEKYLKQGFGRGCLRAIAGDENVGTQSVPFQ